VVISIEDDDEGVQEVDDEEVDDMGARRAATTSKKPRLPRTDRSAGQQPLAELAHIAAERLELAATLPLGSTDVDVTGLRQDDPRSTAPWNDNAPYDSDNDRDNLGGFRQGAKHSRPSAAAAAGTGSHRGGFIGRMHQVLGAVAQPFKVLKTLSSTKPVGPGTKQALPAAAPAPLPPSSLPPTVGGVIACL
jgi:hypothetical protein